MSKLVYYSNTNIVAERKIKGSCYKKHDHKVYTQMEQDFALYSDISADTTYAETYDKNNNSLNVYTLDDIHNGIKSTKFNRQIFEDLFA